jgi:S1-C subfamily serine protease
MSLADTIATVRSGIFKIIFANANDETLGGGSAFLVNGLLVTNHHVFMEYQSANRVGIRRDDMPPDLFRSFSPDDFAKRLVTGSTEQSYDYAVLNIPEVVAENDHQFTLEPPGSRRVGDAIALLGFPFEHDNLTCHQGIISSFYQSALANVIQLDASVNAGNSGGPLIDPETGAAFGIVTRKATGLSRIFLGLRNSLNAKVSMVQAAATGNSITVNGIDLVQALMVSRDQIILTLNEIERQANVGIGYAFSAEHILDELGTRMKPGD